MRYIKFLALIIFFVASMLFFVENKEVLSTGMTLKYALLQQSWTSIPVPFYLVILIAFLVGGILSLFYFLGERIRLAKQLKSCNAHISRLEQEVNSLRNMPLDEEKYPSDNASDSDEQAGA